MGKPMSRQSFMDLFRLQIETSTTWINKFEKTDKVKTGTKMDADEPLITEYQLDDWMNSKARTTTNLQKLRNFDRKAAYRGIVRK